MTAKQIRERLDAIREKAGGSLSYVTDPAEQQEVRTLHAHLRKLEKEPDRRFPLPGSGRGAGNRPSRDWKAGHWSAPVLKEVGTKGLTSGSVVVPSLTAGIVPIPDRPVSLLDVIPSEPVDETNLYAYLRETVRTHAAAETAPGAVKPTSVYTVEKVEDSVRTIATISEPINRFDLEDAQLLAAYVDQSLRQSVTLRLDSQILNGNGTAPNLRGILNTSGIQVQAFSTSLLQTARKALSLLYAIEIPMGVYVMSPAQWEAVELAQLTSGAYLMQPGQTGAPVDLAARRLWGQPVVVTSALSGADALLFAPGFTQLWERGGVRVDWSEAPVGSQAGHSAFKTNELIFRAEGRWGFGVTRPTAVVRWAMA